MKALKYLLLSGIVLICFGFIFLGSSPANFQKKTTNSFNPQQVADLLKTPQQLPITSEIISKGEMHPSGGHSFTEYLSQNMSTGVIGTINGQDSPSDNTFVIDLDKALSSNKYVWLEYELFGVEDYNSITHSINDNLATGGCVVKKSDKWTKQREAIRPEFIKEGKNVIRFTAPVDKNYLYMVKNVSLRVEDNPNAGERRLVINQPSTSYYYKTFGYLQGFVEGDGSSEAVVTINSKKSKIINGIFEEMVSKPDNTEESWSALVEAKFADGQVLQTRVEFDKPIEWDVYNGFDKALFQAETFVLANQAFEVNLQGASIKSDSCTINSDVNISITALRAIDFPPLEAGMVNVTGGHDGYRFLPHGTNFSGEVDITLSYDSCKIPIGYTPKDIVTYYFDESTRRWIALPRMSINLAKNSITSATTHFTDMINGIIKLPESPQTSAYTPTSIKDIKAANPLDGMRVIEPPTANNNGTANLSFPIEIPAGRHGMQPNLTLQYNSGGGNGWMGLGWDISLPAISVETRWGVPHYDPTYETETYLMSGEQLVTADEPNPPEYITRNPPVFRDTLRTRLPLDRRFYPRVEGAFDRIIRHGDSPTNYWWEVIDRNGIISYYGKRLDSDQINDAAVLQDDSGNVAYWALTQTKDLHGNAIAYFYDIVTDAGIPNGTVMGKQIYLKSINYTGFQNENNYDPGFFNIEFARYDALAGRRKDVIINARYGFKEVTACLLKSIKISGYNSYNNLIRSYYFSYTSGEFNKSLLCSFCEVDKEDGEDILLLLEQMTLSVRCGIKDLSILKKHVISYHNDIKIGEGPYQLFNSTPVTLNTHDDHVAALLKNGKYTTAISGTKTKEKGIGGSFQVGLGRNTWSKEKSLGVSYDYSKSESNGHNTLIDLNGDGLPDKVIYQRDNGLKYRRQYQATNGLYYFDSAVQITGHDKFLYEESVTKNWGGEANFYLQAGICNPKSESYTKIYFADANGDGLPDIVDNGAIFYNTINSSGHPSFKPDTTDTISIGGIPCQYTVISGEVNDSVDIRKGRDLPQEDVSETPLVLDNVRYWVAPYSGTITIKSKIQLLQDTSFARKNSRKANGVRYRIQYNSSEKLIDTIGPRSYLSKNATLSFSVTEGSRIYFRLQSNDDRTYDKVVWNPVIFYEDTSVIDPDQKKIKIFNAASDFLLNSGTKFYAPVSGSITIDGTIDIPALSDNVTFKITKNGNFTVFDTTISSGTSIDIDISRSISVSADDSLEFFVTSSTNVNWSSIKFKPHILYTLVGQDTPMYVTCENGIDSINPFQYYPTVNYSIFQVPVFPTTINTVIGSGTQYISPRLHFSSSHSGGQIVMAIKKSNQLLSKQTLTIPSNTVLVTAPQLGFQATNGANIYIEYFTSNRALALAMDSCRSLYNGVYYNSGLHTAAEDSMISKFGCLYRGWGQFAYNNVNYADYNNTIYESRLILPNANISDTNYTINDTVYNDLHTTISKNTASPRKSYLMPMSINVENNKYAGLGNLTWILADTMGNIPVFVDDATYEETIPLVSINGGKVRAINKKTESKSWCYSLSYSEQNFGASVNGSHGYTQTLMDYIDLNGDKYPDIVGNSYVQFSTPQGGLEKNVWDFTQMNEPSLARNVNWAVSANTTTSFPMMKKVPSSKVGRVMTSIVPTGSVSASGGWGTNRSTCSWIDVNGDGLPDRVSNSGEVFMNLGYKLAGGEPWSINEIATGRSFNKGASFGGLPSQDYQKNNYSFSGGLGFGNAANKGNEFLSDINGDGLIDRVYLDGTLLDSTMHVMFNSGNGEWTDAIEVEDQSSIENGLSRSETVNAAGTGGIFFLIPMIPTPLILKFELSLHGALTWGFHTGNIQLMDINNDGYPDLLLSDQENSLMVYYSKIGNTNLLKSVDNYIGGSFEINYGLSKSTFDCSSRMRTMDSLKIYDGFPDDGPAYKLSTFEYDSAYYSRFERESFGFRVVKTHQINTDTTAQYCYRTKTEKFHNTNYLFKGLKYYELTQDRNGNKYIESEYTYILKTIAEGDSIDVMHPYCYGEGYSAISQEDHYYYEGQVTPAIHTAKRYRHGRFGNVIGSHDYGQVNLAWDDIFTHVEYHEIPNNKKNIISAPHILDVSGNNTPLRHRDAVIDTSNGNVLQINMDIGNGTATYNMRYDFFGNLQRIMYPPNDNGQPMVLNYTYDGNVRTYIHGISDTLGYIAQFAYEPEYGNLLSSSDITGNHINYNYDKRGRLISVTAPYEHMNLDPYTIRFEYWDRSGGIVGSNRPDKVPWARTLHYDPEFPNNPIKTMMFADAQGKVLQVKKDISLWNSSNNTEEEMMSVSGRVIFDAFDRTIQTYYPTVVGLTNDSIMDTLRDILPPSVVQYDVLDRQLKSITPDGKLTKYAYGFGPDFYSDTTFKTTITDANNHATATYTDAGGRKTSVKAPYSTWTGLRYNALGELIESKDPEGHVTSYGFDMMGRKVFRAHPDAGTTIYTYDPAGNLIHQQTEYLASTSENIDYTYYFNRLTEINYPHNPENNVKYEYGPYNSSGSNQAGRIVKQLDASGLQQFWYGRLGEIIKNTHSFVLPHDREITFTSLFKYDSWNRMKKVTYPDGEVVSYKYNKGGLFKSMGGVKPTQTFKYVIDVRYDKFEKKTFLWSGNGTQTEYLYNDLSQNLWKLKATDSSGIKMLDKEYIYDNTDNILQVSDVAPKHFVGSDTIGGPGNYSYAYDSLYRLITANGVCHNKNYTDNYELGMSYSGSGLILQKSQLHTRNGVPQTATTYSNAYNYSTTIQPHTPLNIGNIDYIYNVNGDMIKSTDINTGTVQKLRWDEESRLKLFCVQKEQVGSYLYDAGGERYLKILGSHVSQTLNGQTTIDGYAEIGQTLYVNPFMVVNDKGYTKHYYTEGNRIASKIGDGMNISGTIVNDSTAPPDLWWYRPYVGFYQDSTLRGFNLQTSTDYDTKTTDINNMLDRDLDSINEGPYLSFYVKLSPIVNTALTQDNPENKQYFFHTDHLGSSNYVSDVNGIPTQRLEYLPFGEILVNENRSNYSTPYKFSAKELDEESGLSYYGARYYDPRTSVFLGVDPLADKYPNLSPFAYCRNNPIMLIDPDGREGYEINEETGKISKVNETKYYKGKDGSITPVNKGDTYHGGDDAEVDQVVNSKGNSTYVTHGVMGEKQQNESERQLFQFGNSKEAKEFYYWAAGSSQAEWAFADMKSGEGIVGTDYQSGNTSIPGFLENSNGDNIKLLSHSHNGSGGGPSEKVWIKDHYESGDLRNAADSKYPDIQRQVYDVPGRLIFEYNGRTLGSGEKASSKPFNRGR